MSSGAEALGARDLRCRAFGGGDFWEAICTDLDIAVSGASLSEVRSSLEICVKLYLEEAADASPDHRRYLLTRRSPWFVRARLAVQTRVSWRRRGTGASWTLALPPEFAAIQ